MPTHSFDSFLRTLQLAVGHAQRAATEQHRIMLERMIEAGEDGAMKSRSWSVRVPALPPGSPEDFESLTMPLLDLQRLRQPRVAGFTLDIDVEIKTDCRRYSNGLKRVSLVIPKYLQSPGHKSRRLHITLSGPQPGSGEALIDGAPLKRLDSSLGADDAGPERSFFRRLLRFLYPRFLFRRGPIRLKLSEEEAKRLRDIFPERSS